MQEKQPVRCLGRQTQRAQAEQITSQLTILLRDFTQEPVKPWRGAVGVRRDVNPLCDEVLPAHIAHAAGA